MTDSSGFAALSPCTLSDVLTRENVMDIGIRPLWEGMPRIAGPAFTVQLVPGDNLMLHAAIYRAPRGSIIVVDAGDSNFAVAGGNVCAVAQRNGIAGFVIDGTIRDVAEARNISFPIFARGAMPIPGAKEVVGQLNTPIRCGGARVSGGDIIVADEEGIVVVPKSKSESVLKSAQAKAAKDAQETLDSWQSKHQAKIDEILQKKGFAEAQHPVTEA